MPLQWLLTAVVTVAVMEDVAVVEEELDGVVFFFYSPVPPWCCCSSVSSVAVDIVEQLTSRCLTCEVVLLQEAAR